VKAPGVNQKIVMLPGTQQEALQLTVQALQEAGFRTQVDPASLIVNGDNLTYSRKAVIKSLGYRSLAPRTVINVYLKPVEGGHEATVVASDARLQGTFGNGPAPDVQKHLDQVVGILGQADPNPPDTRPRSTRVSTAV
jgi:hypothetical protein